MLPAMHCALLGLEVPPRTAEDEESRDVSAPMTSAPLDQVVLLLTGVTPATPRGISTGQPPAPVGPVEVGVHTLGSCSRRTAVPWMGWKSRSGPQSREPATATSSPRLKA